jgi:hypothetical protein
MSLQKIWMKKPTSLYKLNIYKPNTMRLLKLLLDQNSTMIYYKFNDDFKNHIIFERTQEEHEVSCNITRF